MPPSFYDAPSPPPVLFIAPHDPSPTSSSSLPTLAAVLGLVGGLVVLSFFTSICIYIFRGRLYTAVSVAKREEKAMQDYMEGQASFSDQISICSTTGNSEKLVDHSQESIPKAQTLRPFLLNTKTTSKRQHKKLLLPRLHQIQSYQTVIRPTPAMIKRQSFPFGTRKQSLKSLPSASTFLKVSISCPASLSQAMTFSKSMSVLKGSGVNDGQYKSASNDPKFFRRISHPIQSTSIHSVQSSRSANRERSSFSADYLDWNHQLNSPSDNLFYQPELSSSNDLSTCGTLGTSSVVLFESTREVFDKQDEEQVEELLIDEELDISNSCPMETGRAILVVRRSRLALCATPVSKRPSRCNIKRRRPSVLVARLDKANSQAPIHGARVSKLRSLNASFRRSSKMEKKLTISPVSEEKVLPPIKLQSRKKASASRRGSPVKSKSTTKSPVVKTHSKKTASRSPKRQPLGAITNLNTQAGALSSPSRSKAVSPPRSRPSLFLNGEPADDLATMTPSRFSLSASPPCDPEFLNLRWMPRPATPPLTVTVFVKDRVISAGASNYPGRRLTLTPPAGTSLTELRGSIERALGQNIGSLRGMVLVGQRSMFLPLLSERFYAQWVKERVQEGGVGVIETWRQVY